MTTQSLTELEAFYQYLGDKLKNGASKMSVEESVQAFREYQRIHEAIQQGIDSMEAGEGIPLEEADAQLRKELGFPPPQ